MIDPNLYANKVDAVEPLSKENAKLHDEVKRLESYAKDRDNDARGMTRLCEQYRAERDAALLQVREFRQAADALLRKMGGKDHPLPAHLEPEFLALELLVCDGAEKRKCEHKNIREDRFWNEVVNSVRRMCMDCGEVI